MDSNSPIHRERCGNITVSIWENVGEDKQPYYTYSLPVKRYQQDGEWKTATTLQHSDILNAAKAMDRAHTWVENVLAQGRENSRVEQERRPQRYTQRVGNQEQRRGRE